MASAGELRDQAVAELKLTTAGWRKPNGQPNYPSGTAPMTTHWGKAMALLAQIEEEAPPPPPPDPGHGTLIFEDQFDTLRWGIWRSGIWGYDTDDPEKQAQVYRPANATVSGGILSLTAKKENATTNWGGQWAGKVYPYTSGMIGTDPLQTSPGFSFTYGYVEARIKIPAGKGLWPAFWFPSNSQTPGEIDVMEILGHEPQKLHMNYHGAFHQGSSYTAPQSLAADWHIYAVDWRQGSIKWYLDGVQRWQLTDSRITAHPKYLTLNLAVGGPNAWPGAPDASTVFPATMQVDWVKVWR